MMGMVCQRVGAGVEMEDGGGLFFTNVGCLWFLSGGGLGSLNCRRRPMY